MKGLARRTAVSRNVSNTTMAQIIAVSTTKNKMFLMRSIALMICAAAARCQRNPISENEAARGR
jgi:hypothetical protein